MSKPSLVLVCAALLGPALAAPGVAEEPLEDVYAALAVHEKDLAALLEPPILPLLGRTCDPRDPLPQATSAAAPAAWSLREVDPTLWGGHELALHVADARTAYVAAKRFLAEPQDHAPAELRVSRTHDAGRTWVTGVVDPDAVEDASLVDQSVAIDGIGRTVFVAYLRAPEGDSATRSLRLARSDDAGATWTLTTVRAAYAGGHVSLRVFDASTAALAHRDLSRAPHNGHLEVLLTQDGGATWTASGAFNGSSGWYASLAARTPRDMQVAHYGAGERALSLGATTDGHTWTNQTLRRQECWQSGLAPSLARTPGRSLLTYQEHSSTLGLTRVRVAASADDGATWTHAALDEVGALALDTATLAQDPQRAYNAWFRMQQDGTRAVRVGETTDGGASWRLRTVPDPAGAYLDLGRADEGTLVVAYQTDQQTLRVALLDA